MTVFKFTAKNGRIDYLVTNKDNPTRQYVKSIMDARWSVEVYHLEVKKIVVLNAVRLARVGCKEIIFFSQFLRGLNNINAVYLKK
nr:hypothetical protein [Candidatus Arsenophonus triatominarum]